MERFAAPDAREDRGHLGDVLEPGARADLGDAPAYGGYLALPELLACQRPLSASHDEPLFIIVHQASELWLKLVVHELRAARGRLRADDLAPSFKMMARVSRVQERLVRVWDVLSTLIPADYLTFRHLLGGLGKAREAHLADDRGGIQSAMSMIDAALGQLAELRGEAGATGARLETIAEGQRSTALYLDEVVTRIEDVDLPETLARIAQDQAGLEAAYLTTGRISQLSLADYLR